MKTDKNLRKIANQVLLTKNETSLFFWALLGIGSPAILVSVIFLLTKHWWLVLSPLPIAFGFSYLVSLSKWRTFVESKTGFYSMIRYLFTCPKCLSAWTTLAISILIWLLLYQDFFWFFIGEAAFASFFAASYGYLIFFAISYLNGYSELPCCGRK